MEVEVVFVVEAEFKLRLRMSLMLTFAASLRAWCLFVKCLSTKISPPCPRMSQDLHLVVSGEVEIEVEVGVQCEVEVKVEMYRG